MKLTITDLAVHRGGRPVLDGFSLSVPSGEVFGLLGPNGAGKSSAFLALMGLIPADRGEVTLDGELTPLGGPDLRSRAGIVFQEAALDERLTPRENLSLAAALYGIPRGEVPGRIAGALDAAGLADRAKEPVKRLSGGMRRRLELARAMIHEPALLLMDEPTSGLDEASYRLFWERIREISGDGGATVLLTTHRAEEAERCDRLAFLDGGAIVAEGTPEELKQGLGGVIELVADDPEDAVERIRAELGLEGVIRRHGLSHVFLELTGHELTESA